MKKKKAHREKKETNMVPFLLSVFPAPLGW
jgi:hypothetical protein